MRLLGVAVARCSLTVRKSYARGTKVVWHKQYLSFTGHVALLDKR